MILLSAGQLQAKKTASNFENFKTLSIIPKPISVNKTTGSFVLYSGLNTSSTDSISAKIAKKFSRDLRKRNGIILTKRNKQSQINFITTKKIPKEGYELQVTKQAINLKASDYSGFLYGIETLYQLMPSKAYQVGKLRSKINVDCAIITDAPAYHYRGIMLDVCRHYIKVPKIKELLDLMVSQKLNTFHWHLTEDQAWRIEIKKYPRLTQVGAWRDDIGFGLDADTSDNYRKSDGKYGGFYTQEQIKDIIKYATARGITIIPEIELPGHAVAALAAYPELGCTGGPYTIPDQPGVYPDVYCAGNEKVFKFLEDVISEVAALFPAPYIHIGGDECPKSQWKKCPKCQARMKANNCKNEHELQSYFITRMEKFINSKGKKLIGWDEILEGGLAPNATVMSWRGMNGGIKAANMGHDVIMTPTTYCYFDYAQSRSGEPKSMSGFLPMEKVYQFNPTPTHIAADKRHHILGGQANVWTEFMPNSEHIQYMLAPRISALSECVWSDGSKKNWKDFSKRMSVQFQRFGYMGINYRKPRNVQIKETKAGITLSSPVVNSRIVYTTNGSNPTNKSRVFTQPLKFKGKTILKVAVMLEDGTVFPVTTKIMNLPTFKVKQTFGQHENNTPDKALDGSIDSAFWGSQVIQKGDHFTLTFDKPQPLKFIKVFTGNKKGGDSLTTGDELLISLDGSTFKRVAKFKKNGVAKFQTKKILKVKAIQIKANNSQESWLMIREIAF